MILSVTDWYISRMRNPRKRAYAWHYSRWLFGQRCRTPEAQSNYPEPDWRDANLSYTAAQAVRMEVRRLMGVE